MSWRPALVVALAVVLPGCILGGGDWYLSGVSATATFQDEAWDRERAVAGLRAVGFEPGPSAPSVVVGGNGTWSVSVTLREGAVSASFIRTTNEHAGSREDAEARAAEVRREMEPRVEAMLAAFEAAAGWTHEGDLRWSEGLLQGD